MGAPTTPPDPANPSAFGGPGGAAVFRGTNYQTNVTSYIAAIGLAEQPHQLGETFPVGAPMRIGAEQHWPIDDVAVWFGRPIAWIQAKGNADLGDLRDSFSQFVGQLQYGRGRGDTFEPLGAHDRFIFAYEHAPAWAETAIDVLQRLRDGARSIDEITQGSAPARDAYDKLAEAARTADATLDTKSLHSLLQRVYFFPMTTAALEAATRSALHFVVHRDNVAQAEDVLYRHLDDVAARRSLRTIDALRTVLSEAGCVMLAAPSVRDDVAVLLSETERTLDAAAATSSIATADGNVHLDRAVTTAIVDALAQGNVVVTAPAGEGKSVALRDAAQRLRAAGHHVVFLQADDAQPRLQHTLAQIFERWGEAGFLFIDGFDSLRLGPAAAPLRPLIGRMRDTGWHVAIASREYDLERDPPLRRLFPAGPAIPQAYRDDCRFPNVSLIRVGALEASEIRDLRSRSTSLDRLFEHAPTSLAELLTNAFNLSIAASLAGDVDLSGVRDRGDLLNLWWENRVATGGSANEAALRAILRAMIRRRRLDVPTADIDAHADARDSLLSLGVLIHRGSADDPIAFRHAAIFDYAVERLLLRGQGAPTELLGADPDAFVFILPSVRAHFEALYGRSPAEFFAEFRGLLAVGRGRAALSLVLAQIPALRLRDATDIALLLDGGPTHAKIFHHVVSAALYWAGKGVPLVGPNVGPWADVALFAAQQLPMYAHDAALLVDEASKETARPDQGRALARASRLLVINYLATETPDSRVEWFAPIALPGFIRTIDYDPSPALPLLRRIAAPERIARVGQFELFPLAASVDRLHSPDALELLYSGVFADVTLPAGIMPIARPNVAINLVQESKQILVMVRGMLARRFASFLDEAPREAIRSMCAVVGAHRHGRSLRPIDIVIAGVPRRLLADSSDFWESMPHHDDDDWKVVTQAFEARLRTDLDGGQAKLFTIALETITAHFPHLLLWGILIRNAGRTAESTRAVLPFVTQRVALVQPELQESLVDYLRGGYARLVPADRAMLDEVIVSVGRDETNERLREYRADLVATYADAIPDGLSPTLAAYRHATPPTQRERELTLRGITEGRPSDFFLPNATVAAPAAFSRLAEANAFLTGGGTTEMLAQTARRLHYEIASADVPPPETLATFVRLVREGMVRKVLSDEELREWTPLLLSAAAVDSALDENDD